VRLEFKKLHPDAILPTYGSAGAAGMDVYAIEDTYLHGHAKIKTGLAVAIPDGYELQVRPRSGLASNSGITVLNSPGTIDSDYRGELVIMLVKHTDWSLRIQKGDRIAQLVLAPVTRAEVVEVAELDATDRGGSGFGSTGR
jgi:dUTP pyrophosphatase